MRVLFLTHRLPYAPNRGDRIRAFHIARWLASRADLELVSLVHDAHEEAQHDLVRSLGVRLSTFRVPRVRNLMRGALGLAGREPLTHCLLDAAGVAPGLQAIVSERPPDVVLAYCSSMARFALAPPLAHLPCVLDLVDVDSEKWVALGAAARPPMSWIYRREARLLAPFEARAARHAHVTLVVNERERRALLRLAPDASVHVMPMGVDLSELRPPAPAAVRPVVVFCGVMNYEPNVQGVLWFTRDVWPRILAHEPAARFVIVGSDPTPAVQRLASDAARIEVTGRVPDVRRYLWDAAVSVAPLKTARGLQTKVLEALAAGLPTIVTSQVFEGLPDAVRGGCQASDTAEDFAEATLRLLALDGDARRAVAETADLDAMSWSRQLEPLLPMLEDAVSAGVRVRARRAAG